MKQTPLFLGLVAVGLIALLAAQGPQAQPPPPQPPVPIDPSAQPGDTEPGVEPQTRGPVHEAFAQPETADPQPSPIVPKRPPDGIDEMPPEEQPEGANVGWIPGYWAWEDD